MLPAPPDLTAILPPPFAWSSIPAGPVTIDFAEGSTHTFIAVRRQTFDLPAFFMATYPLTTDQYQTFIDSLTGYRLTRWWSFSSPALDWRRTWEEPAPALKAPGDAPRTRLSWYESVAFCRWLAEQVTISDGWTLSLPTEQQWQRAAQGDDERVYPWGNDFDPSRTNTGETYSGAPASVTAYPAGASPFGVMDMSGNTWEWTCSQPGSLDASLKGDVQRILRGGSWTDPAADARCAARFAAAPHTRDTGFGLRIVYTEQTSV